MTGDKQAEQFVLGAILLNESAFVTAAATLGVEDFSLEAHRRIFARMADLSERGEKIDRVTVGSELNRRGQLESCGGMSYLVSLDDGLPQVVNLESYARIVKDKAVLSRIARNAQKIVSQCELGEEEPDKILAAAEDALLRIGEERNNRALLQVGQIMRGYEGGINAFLDPSKRPKGLSTGFLRLDEKTGGMHAGELFILAARPSMGKTAMALNIAQHVAVKLGQPVAVFSLEMSKESLLTRLACSSSRIDSQRFRHGCLCEEERVRLASAAAELDKAPLFIDDTANLTVMDIHAKLRQLKARHGLGLAIVDYLQLMAGRGRFENRVQEVSALSRGLKLLSKELAVPILVLSQLNRAPESRKGDHRPQLSDLRESGGIEQDADVVAFLFREEVYQPDNQKLRGMADLILAKQRQGPIGKIKLVFLHHCTRFENLAEEAET